MVRKLYSRRFILLRFFIVFVIFFSFVFSSANSAFASITSITADVSSALNNINIPSLTDAYKNFVSSPSAPKEISAPAKRPTTRSTTEPSVFSAASIKNITSGFTNSFETASFQASAITADILNNTSSFLNDSKKNI